MIVLINTNKPPITALRIEYSNIEPAYVYTCFHPSSSGAKASNAIAVRGGPIIIIPAPTAPNTNANIDLIRFQFILPIL